MDHSSATEPEPRPRAEDRWVGRVIAERFRIEGLIGSGAMARVYRAVSLADGTRVAIKLLHARLAGDSRVAARFRREARAASRLSHPNALRIVAFGEEKDEPPFIAMELLEGDDLGTIIHREAPLAPIRIARLICPALRALDHAHRAGVIHRDFKPENVMTTRGRDGRERVKVCDFGMAKITEGKTTAITRSGHVCGTPEYMAPEQARGQPVDLRTDVYAAGVTLYQMLTGQLPFEGASPLATITQHVREQPVPPRRVRPEWDIPPELERVALKALAKAPEERFQSAAEMAAAIERAVALPGAAREQARESPLWLAALPLAIALLAFGIWLWVQ